MNTNTMPKTVLAAVAIMFSTAIAQSGASDYTVSLTGLSSSSKTLDMVYVEGGTYQRGCSTGDNQCVTSDETPAHNITLSDYFIGKYEITNAQWNAVMGGSGGDNKPKTSITWYDAVEFTCKLSELTGKKYRLATDAEFEFAARGGTESKGYRYSGSNTANDVAWNSGSTFPQTCYGSGQYQTCFDFSSTQDVGSLAANELGIYDMSGNVYEWMYDNWGSYSSSLNGSTDYTTVHSHMQKVRRGGSYDQPASESRVSARKIRSIEGKDGSIGLRIALSVADTRPPNMTDPCEIHQPIPSGGKKGFRDKRLITADDEVWAGAYSGVLIVKENSAIMASVYGTWVTTQAQGEWYTLNNFSLNIVSTSDTTIKYIYYLIDDNNMSLMAEGGSPSRWERKKASEVSNASSVAAPTIDNPKTPEELAPAGYSIDMADPPTNEQDSRLIEGTDYAWWQNNSSAGGTHHYRFDFDTKDSSRFVVYDAGAGTSVPLAAGKWFTVDNHFLRIIDNNGCNYDYLYTVTSNGNTYYHISYQEYEPGDSRVFAKTAANNVTGWFEPTFSSTIDQGCSVYIPPSDDDQTSILPQIAVNINNQVLQTKNGLNLQSMNGATVEIYGIKGNLISRQNYASGTHSVSFAHLSKGMYIVKVRFGSSIKVLRMPVM